MRGSPRVPGAAEGHLGIAGLSELPAASSFLSVGWSNDNLVTPHPARLYNGRLSQLVSRQSLEHVLSEVQKTKGPVRQLALRKGTVTWDISCDGDEGPFLLQVPLALDEPGNLGRSRLRVPERNIDNLRYFFDRGLTRYVLEPHELLLLQGTLPVAVLPALPQHCPLHFARGAMHLFVSEENRSWLLPLGQRATASLLTEIVAILAYHYEPTVDGGSAITDVSVNDGDFLAKRRADGSFELCLRVVRWRQGGIHPELLLLYLIQMVAYEPWDVEAEKTGIPVIFSNPSIVFHGLIVGRKNRYRDLGLSEEEGGQEALQWIQDFARSPEGRAYRPWTEKFCKGELPPSFGEDLREHWWRLLPLRQRQLVLELRQSSAPDGAEAHAARSLKTLLDGLSQEIGRGTPVSMTKAVNHLGREELLLRLEEAKVPQGEQEGLADEWLCHWPYLSWEHLLSQVPRLESFLDLKSLLTFDQALSEEEPGRLSSLASLSAEESATRPLANPEIFSALAIPPALHPAATQSFPTFESYMDAALHDPQWGYYGHSVLIGKRGHFNTHPEMMSPHYGRWLCTWAFQAWREMLEKGDLLESEPFTVIEFGAGNGRLARDFVDAASHKASDLELADHANWKLFASVLQYRIYELSDSLREKQRRLLGDDALVAKGDARRPQETLQRDFPGGVKGFIVTNEVPDTFGVHKVVLTSEGRALVALVIPRVELALKNALSKSLSRQITLANEALRSTFAIRSNPSDDYLDEPVFLALMQELADLSASNRESLLSGLWFEECYVSATCIPDLAAHLAKNAAQYAQALAAEDSGVVLYLNLHANLFVRQLGSSLAAGFLITIDYGDSTWGLVQGVRRGDFRLRIYGDTQREFVPRPSDPYTLPGFQDLTADLNFTDLARAGEEVGLQEIYFGYEVGLCGTELPSLLPMADKEPFSDLFDPSFKVLVMGSRASDAFTCPGLAPLSLCSGAPEGTASRPQKIAMIQKILSELE